MGKFVSVVDIKYNRAMFVLDCHIRHIFKMLIIGFGQSVLAYQEVSVEANNVISIFICHF